MTNLLRHAWVPLRWLPPTAVGLGLAGALLRQALMVPGHAREDVLRPIHELYLGIRDQLAGTSPAAAMSFGLGRMLADTAFLPTKDTPDVLREQFDQFRLENAYWWLNDLDAALPPHSAAAVASSLSVWEQWVSDHSVNGEIDPKHFDATLIRLLGRQGELWRRLLTGEKAAEALLDARAYRDAATSMFRSVRRLLFRYLWKWLCIVILVVAVAGTAIVLSLVYVPAGTDRVTSVAVSAAGFLGVSWTGIRATLGRVLGKAEHSLWEAEVEAAIGRAATVQPGRKINTSEPPEKDEPEEGPPPAVVAAAPS